MFPDFMTTAQDVGKVVGLTHRQPLPPGNAPRTHFCQRLSRPQGHSATGMIMSLKKFQRHHRESNPRLAGLQSSALTTTPPRARKISNIYIYIYIKQDQHQKKYSHQQTKYFGKQVGLRSYQHHGRWQGRLNSDQLRRGCCKQRHYAGSMQGSNSRIRDSSESTLSRYARLG